MSEEEETVEELRTLSRPLDPKGREVSIILAAGHGKRIKSDKSKMLHEIWGKPSVLRVCNAARDGLASPNQVVVVGIKALEVARALGPQDNRIFVYQEEQRGTGHAVQTALRAEGMADFRGAVYILPGDMGLLTAETVGHLRERFVDSGADMLLLTGTYEGPIDENSYGRIVMSKEHPGEIIEIKESRDIRAMEAVYRAVYRGKTEEFSPGDLLEIREFNVGVYAVSLEPLRTYLPAVGSDNVQGEIYVTDLIKIFNDHGLSVRAALVENSDVVSFNVKSVLKEMETTFRRSIYDRLKDIVTIDDPEDFYIAEETVRRIVERDRTRRALDVTIGKGAHLGEDVEIGRGLVVGRNAILSGSIRFGDDVIVGEGVHMSTYPDQRIEIGDGTTIMRGNVIKGMVRIGRNVRIETGVRITGSSEEPVSIGEGVLIKGTTYIFGAAVEPGILVEHSVLKSCRVRRVPGKDGAPLPVKYILPPAEGLNAISHRGEE